MKITKRLFSIVLAVLMLAVMAVPFTASAAAAIPAGPYTITVNGLEGFTATVYKIADFDTTTGAFSNFVEKDGTSTAVATAVKAGFTGASYDANADLLKAAQAIGDDKLSAAKVQDVAFTADGEQNVSLNDAGVYFVKWTAYPSNRTRMQDSVVAMPWYNSTGDAWMTSVVVSDKVAKDEITDNKQFDTAADKTKDVVNKNVGDTVPFVLTGSIPGSAATPVSELWFNDKMTEGLVLNGTTVNVAAYDASSTKHDLAAADYTATGITANSKEFRISFTQAQINALYTNGYKSIEIKYTAKLTSEGVVYGGNGNKNTFTYHYKSGTQEFNDTKVKTVKTFRFSVKKVDANTNAPIDTATFGIYTNATCTTAYTNDLITNAGVTTTNGIAQFNGLKDGTYYIKETAAPTGYALNSKVYTVTISDAGVVSGDSVVDSVLTVPDPKIIVPNTGGAGTMAFTICGIALIAGAAVLFVLYRKRSAK